MFRARYWEVLLYILYVYAIPPYRILAYIINQSINHTSKSLIWRAQSINTFSAWRLILLLACTLFRFKFKHILHKHFNIQYLHLTLSLLSLLLPPARLSTQPPLQHNKTLSLLFAQFQIRFFFLLAMSILLGFQSLVFFPTCAQCRVLFRFHTSNQWKHIQFVSQIYTFIARSCASSFSVFFRHFFDGIVFAVTPTLHPLHPAVLFQFVISINHCYKIALFSLFFLQHNR